VGDIAEGTELTVIDAVVEHEPTLKVITALPAPAALTTPVPVTLATLEELEDHDPPDEVSVSVRISPTQSVDDEGEITPIDPVTLTALVTQHPATV
jgi:hypothetical protein